MAEDYARRYSYNEDDHQGLYTCFIAGFKEAYGIGVKDGADIDINN